MIRKVRTLGLTFVAAFALSAIAASAASADQFVGEVEPMTLTGQNTGTSIATLSIGTVAAAKCNTSSYSGTVAQSPTTSIRVHPTYSNHNTNNQPNDCALEPFGSATVTTTGCDYVITSDTDSNGDAAAHVACTGSNTIKIAGPGCTVSIGSQTPAGGVSFHNFGAGASRTVEVTATVTGVHYTTSGILCGLIGLPSTGTNASYVDTVTVKGYVDGAAHTEANQRGIWVDTT